MPEPVREKSVPDTCVLSSEQLMTKYIDYEMNFVLYPLIYENGINIIGAERGSGKTRFCICLSYCIVCEVKDFLGYPINRHGNILYINLEIKEPDFKLFIEPIRDYYLSQYDQKYQFSILSLLDHPKMPLQQIRQFIKTYEPVLVIIDSLKKFLSILSIEQSINVVDNLTITAFYDILRSWKMFDKLTFLIANHTNKGTKNQKGHSDLMFGPSSLMDYADQTFLLRKTNNPNQRLIVPDKARFSAESDNCVNLIEIISNEDQLYIELVEEDVNEADYMYKVDSNKAYDESAKDEVFRLFDQGLSSRAIQEKTGVYYTTVARWIKKRNN